MREPGLADDRPLGLTRLAESRSSSASSEERCMSL